MDKILDEVININVDSDIIAFLKVAYFGDISDCIKAASNRAYRDMCRTIKFNGLANNIRLELRDEVNVIFKKEISKLYINEVTSQDSFDLWHRGISDLIKRTYMNKRVKLTYGQTQKWINMTIKYLYMLQANSFDEVFKYLHIPLDKYVFDLAKDKLNIKTKPTKAWSKWDDYDKEYLTYQKNIREKLNDSYPLRWEFRHWIKQVSNIK